MEIKKILVPIDGSESARNALRYAAYFAQVCKAELGLLTVVDLNRHISAFEQVSTGGYVPAELKEKGYALLAEAMHEAPREIKAVTQTVIGSPAESIVEICQAGQYDMIVMGSRGLGTIRQLVMGSVSQYVLHHASCPVTVIR